MNSFISEMPGPLVGVNARAPFHEAPITMPMAAELVLGLHDARSCACRSRDRCASLPQKFLNASISDVEGVIGYQAPTVAPAYTHPRPAAVLPSIRMWFDGLVHAFEADAAAGTRSAPSRRRSRGRWPCCSNRAQAGFFARSSRRAARAPRRHVDVEQGRQGARVGMMFLSRMRVADAVEILVAHLRQRHAEHRDVVALEQRRVAATSSRRSGSRPRSPRDVAGVGLRVHRDHEVDAARARHVAVLR
jgi:hypothetical protein